MGALNLFHVLERVPARLAIVDHPAAGRTEHALELGPIGAAEGTGDGRGSQLDPTARGVPRDRKPATALGNRNPVGPQGLAAFGRDPIDRPRGVVDEPHVDLRRAFQAANLVRDLAGDHLEGRAAHEGGQDVDGDLGRVALGHDPHRFHEPEIHDADGHLGIGDRAKHVQDFRFADHLTLNDTRRSFPAPSVAWVSVGHLRFPLGCICSYPRPPPRPSP